MKKGERDISQKKKEGGGERKEHVSKSWAQKKKDRKVQRQKRRLEAKEKRKKKSKTGRMENKNNTGLGQEKSSVRIYGKVKKLTNWTPLI